MSRHLKQKLPQEKVIAMAASVAAFGLCGSSQDIGTEVKSSLFVCFLSKKKEKLLIVWEGKQSQSAEETRPGRYHERRERKVMSARPGPK